MECEKLSKKNPEGYMDLTAYYAMKGEAMDLDRGDVFSIKGDVERYFMVLHSNEKYVTAVSLCERGFGDAVRVEQVNGDVWYIDPAKISYSYYNTINEEEFEPVRTEDVSAVFERIADIFELNSGNSGATGETLKCGTEAKSAVNEELDRINKLYADAVAELKESVPVVEHERLRELYIKEQAKKEVYEGLYKEAIAKQIP